jgi:DNA end-binding protein Ku
VTIPVKLYLATESSGIGFNMLHASCLNRIQMKIYCPFHDEVVPRSETVRGYEWSKGRYVVVTDDDLEAVPLKTIRSIEIAMFVAADQEAHGAEFVKSAYYLEPDPVGKKAFFLLREVLAEANKTAICKVVMKDREQLAAINPYAESMLLTTLHWPDEVRPVEEIAVDRDGIEIKASERKMAEQLIASMTGEFDPVEFRDEYRDALMAVIEAKVAGEEPTPIAQAEPTRIGDLMAALEASVAAAREARRDAAAGNGAAAEQTKPARSAKPTPAKRSRAKKSAEAEEAPQTRRRKTA